MINESELKTLEEHYAKMLTEIAGSIERQNVTVFDWHRAQQRIWEMQNIIKRREHLHLELEKSLDNE